MLEVIAACVIVLCFSGFVRFTDDVFAAFSCQDKEQRDKARRSVLAHAVGVVAVLVFAIIEVAVLP